MYAITGATGQLGRLVIDALLETVPAHEIVAAVRTPGKASELAAKGVQVREADYERPATLAAALTGIDKLLLISSSEVGRRVSQHGVVIEAAKAAGVGLIAYTSILHADVSAIGLAEEHRQTETLIRASGIPFAMLRNGWYTENYMGRIPAALAQHALLGAAGRGRIASAARADYAAAAAAVLTSKDDLSGRTFELAGDEAYTLADLAAEVSRQSDWPVAYKDLPEAEYRTALAGAGLPAEIAALVADGDARAADGALFDEGRRLGALIGRPTTPMRASVGEALRSS